MLQANALCQLGSFDKAKALLAEDSSFLPNDDRFLRAELAETRGSCALSSDHATAKQYFAAASSLARGSDEFIEAAALTNLGFTMSQEGSYDQAIDKYRAGLNITASPFLRQKMLGNLGESYAELGDWRQSISLAEQAVTLAEQIKNDSDRKTWLIDLGRAHLALFEFSSAEPYFKDALAIARRLNNTDAILRCLNDLTQMALAQHDLSAAEKYWKEESALNLGAEARDHVSFDAAGIAMERKEFTKAEKLLMNVLRSNANSSLGLQAQRELGNVYWQEGRAIQADQAFRKAIRDAEVELQRIPPEHRMSFLDEQPFYDPYIRFLMAQHKPVEALKIAERGRAQILSQALRERQGNSAAFDLTKLQATLKKRGEIALAYSVTNAESFLWVVTPVQLKCFRLPGHGAISDQIDVYKSEVVDHPRAIEDSSGSLQLYKTLIQPAEALIPKGSHVVIVTSKILSQINFEALIVPGDHPHYWIEDAEIETASSLALLGRSRPVVVDSGMTKKELFALGAPLEADKDFPTLKNARAEMDRVSSHFPASQEKVVSGKEATPQAYRASKPGQYRYIHIDAHSEPNELNPLDSFVVLSPSQGNSYKLYAHEIIEVPLHADLVTISVCTGFGTRWFTGEGLVGLGWAFLRAGAHQVVASLWPVDDAATPQLMDDFYDGLSKNQSAATALRAAKLKMLHSNGQYSLPYYWASLQLYTGS
jgi:CHAT domain-containing protein